MMGAPIVARRSLFALRPSRKIRHEPAIITDKSQFDCSYVKHLGRRKLDRFTDV
jgi:hypothetical protein